LLFASLAALGADVHVAEAWSRATPPGTTVGVGYVTLHNVGGKALKLIGATSPRATAVEVHETRVDAKGVSTMRPVASVIVAAGAALTFGPGALHLMLVGLKSPLVTGEHVPLTLQFEGEPPDPLQLEVRAPGDDAPEGVHAHHAH
jgi:copper(I)-binding protein